MPAKPKKSTPSSGRPETAAVDYKRIAPDYAWDGSIFTEDDARTSAIKYIINNKLDQVERTIILLYVDCLSYRKLGKRLGFSHMTIRKECQRIKEKIMGFYNTAKPIKRRKTMTEFIALTNARTGRPLLLNIERIVSVTAREVEGQEKPLASILVEGETDRLEVMETYEEIENYILN